MLSHSAINVQTEVFFLSNNDEIGLNTPLKTQQMAFPPSADGLGGFYSHAGL
jgi:hypothetical protein